MAETLSKGEEIFNEYDKVRIKKTGIIGEIIDIYCPVVGETEYTVESDEKGVPGGWGDADSWKLFNCTADELEKI
jgi:hypothetical protein